MPRIRIVPTQLWSEKHLLGALAAVGFPHAEVHAQGAPLLSWRGLPLGPNANVVLRRQSIGSAGDDLGFVRNEHGTYDAVVSEIHFFRFDKRWIEDLERRHAELARADGVAAPPHVRLDQAAADAPTEVDASARARGAERAVRADRDADRDAAVARSLAVGTLEGLRKEQSRFGRIGCLLGLFLPPVLWFVLAGLLPELRSGGGFMGVVAPLWFITLVLVSIAAANKTQRAARELAARLPSSEQARAAAVSLLESRRKPPGAKAEDAQVKSLLKALREVRN